MTRPKKNLGYQYRRGNTTSGALRKGNRNGRPAFYPPGTTIYRVLMTLSDADYAIAVILGNGNVSHGVRRTLAMAASQVPPDAPTTRFEAAQYASKRKKQNRLAMIKAKFESNSGDASPDTDWDDV